MVTGQAHWQVFENWVKDVVYLVGQWDKRRQWVHCLSVSESLLAAINLVFTIMKGHRIKFTFLLDFTKKKFLNKLKYLNCYLLTKGFIGLKMYILNNAQKFKFFKLKFWNSNFKDLKEIRMFKILFFSNLKGICIF